MTTPRWAGIILGCLLGLAAAAELGAAWHWTWLVFLGPAVIWALAWGAAEMLHEFLVPRR